MSRILITLGFLALIGGMIGMSRSIFAPIGDIMSSVGSEEAINERAAALCEEDEELVTETGASSYTPGQGYGTPIFYYCVDDDGDRRDVTGEFGEGILDQTTSLFTSTFSGAFLWGGLMTVGVLMLVFGIIMSVAKRARQMTALGAAQGLMPYSTTNFGTPMSMNPPSSTTSYSSASSFSTPTSGAPSDDVVKKLKQLEDARSANLISQEEYDRLRKDILDSFK